MKRTISAPDKPKSILDHNRNEIIQSYFRFALIVLGITAFLLMELSGTPIENRNAYGVLFGYLLWILAYYLLVRCRPEAFLRWRVLIIMITDIGATAMAMYYVGRLSAVFVAVFLWYIIGYGMRFGLTYAVVGAVATSIAWISLTLTSAYWQEHAYLAIGWQVAFIIIPLYYFLLVKRLHISILNLNRALLKTERLANYDHLTQIPNRHYFNSQAEALLKKSQRIALFMIDLDEFKQINDTYGHNVGDQLLVKVARALEASCDNNCILGRLGGDEFIIATSNCELGTIHNRAETILQKITSATAEYGDISASIGICLCPDDAPDLSFGKSLADTAMYCSKKRGKNRYCLYSSMAEDPLVVSSA